MSTIHTVGVAKFTAPVTGEAVGLVDVSIDDDRKIHLRINNGRDEVVMVIDRWQARRMRQLLVAAIDGFVELRRS